MTDAKPNKTETELLKCAQKREENKNRNMTKQLRKQSGFFFFYDQTPGAAIVLAFHVLPFLPP